jgi:hypothetical protein
MQRSKADTVSRRIGQKKEVHVHRYIVKVSVEERILALQERKVSHACPAYRLFTDYVPTGRTH